MKNTAGKWMRLLAGVAFLASSQSLAAEELAGGDLPFRIVRIDPEICARIATYNSNEADYKPGVAADGSAVAPADLDPVFVPRSTYSFPVEIDPFGGSSPQFSGNTGLVVADVTIDAKTGRTTIDGQDVTGADRALADACARLKDQPAN